MLASFICIAIALYDADGHIHSKSGEKVRLQRTGAMEMNGRARPGQPAVPVDPRVQRRRMAAAIGARVLREDRAENAQLWFARSVRLTELLVRGSRHHRWPLSPSSATRLFHQTKKSRHRKAATSL